MEHLLTLLFPLFLWSKTRVSDRQPAGHVSYARCLARFSQDASFAMLTCLLIPLEGLKCMKKMMKSTRNLFNLSFHVLFVKHFAINGTL